MRKQRPKRTAGPVELLLCVRAKVSVLKGGQCQLAKQLLSIAQARSKGE